jgi:capsular exopolysaccharide synthesis family protein
MSRIFDALRRLEQMKGGVGLEIPPDTAAPSLEVLEPFSREKDGLENVERVAYRPQPENHVLGAGESDRLGLERFKLLRYRLYRLREQRTVRSILVTSAIPKEGKTTVAANLAVTLVQASDRVLLVDADLRKPSLHSILGLRPAEGLAGHLQGRVELLSSLRRVDPLGFFFLTAGCSPANPVELLQGESMRSAVKNTATTFDWVVIDSPPILPLADGRVLASLCDAVIVVVREEHTRQEDLQEVLAALKGTNLAGIVLNGSKSMNKSAYAYYYPTAPSEETTKRSGKFGRQITKGQVLIDD